jgi:hypothetical protein
VWLASSTRLGYLEHRDLMGRIVAVNADGSGAQQEMAPAAGLGALGTALSLTADGRWAVRVVDERGLGRLRLAPVLPDGARFLFTGPAAGASGTPQRMILVQHWEAEFEPAAR